MRNLKLILFLMTVQISLNMVFAQENIVALKPFSELDMNYVDNTENVYIKDITNELNKFIGLWIAEENGISYKFKIDKNISKEEDFDYKIDVLSIDYEIKEVSSGNIIKTTLNENYSNTLQITGVKYEKSELYRLFYLGDNYECGQVGDILIKKTSANHLLLKLLPDHITIRESECPNGYITQILPLKYLDLSRLSNSIFNTFRAPRSR